MPSCTFIGHKDTPKEIEPILELTLIDLILNKNVSEFLVGNRGNFDFMAENLLKKLKVKYPHINYTVVLAYITDSHNLDYGDTVFPDELAATPPKFAIDRRNKWMIKKCDFLVCYVRHNFSNSHKFKEYAKKQNKTIFNLYLLSNLTDC